MAILLDWMLELCDAFDQSAGTFFGAIHLLHLELQQQLVWASHYQELACACMALSSKLWEDEVGLSLSMLYHMSDGAFELQSLKRRELLVLANELQRPTSSLLIATELPSDLVAIRGHQVTMLSEKMGKAGVSAGQFSALISEWAVCVC